MEEYVSPASDRLIFTDYSFYAGGITDGTGPVAVLSQGALLMLRDLFFPSSTTTTSRTELEKMVAGILPQASEQEVRTAATSFVSEIPGIEFVNAPLILGKIQTSNYESDSRVSVGAVSTFVPAGRLYQRKIGEFTLYFAVAADSLAGIVTPDPTISAVAVDHAGIHVLLQTHHPYCGVCGTCGLCVFCGEINYGVASAASASLIAVLSTEPERLPAFAQDSPQPLSTAVAGRRPRSETGAEIRKRTRPLLDIPDIIAGTFPKGGDQ